MTFDLHYLADEFLHVILCLWANWLCSFIDSWCILYNFIKHSNVRIKIRRHGVWWFTPVNPVYLVGIGRRSWSKGSPKQKAWDPVWKVTKAKKDWDVAQVVECLPSKSKALNSKPSTTKKKMVFKVRFYF
jgi:hypothetical protein